MLFTEHRAESEWKWIKQEKKKKKSRRKNNAGSTKASRCIRGRKSRPPCRTHACMRYTPTIKREKKEERTRDREKMERVEKERERGSRGEVYATARGRESRREVGSWWRADKGGLKVYVMSFPMRRSGGRAWELSVNALVRAVSSFLNILDATPNSPPRGIKCSLRREALCRSFCLCFCVANKAS